MLRVAQARVRAGNQVVAGEPKTARGRRTIALDLATVAALRQYRRCQTEERLLAGPRHNDSGLVFTMPDGSPIHPNQFGLWFRRRIRTAGLPAIRLHDMRSAVSARARVFMTPWGVTVEESDVVAALVRGVKTRVPDWKRAQAER